MSKFSCSFIVILASTLTGFLFAISVSTSSNTVCCKRCPCPSEANPICGMVLLHDPLNQKRYNFTNECEFLCAAKCLQERVKFLHCGLCDERPLLPLGHKGSPKMLSCLRFLEQRSLTLEDREESSWKSFGVCTSEEHDIRKVFERYNFDMNARRPIIDFPLPVSNGL